MAKKPRKKRGRTERRIAQRKHQKLVADRVALALLEAGGRPEYPLEVQSASIVESRAESLECPRCEGALRAETHAAVIVDDVRLRRVDTKCLACESVREVWVRIVCTALN